MPPRPAISISWYRPPITVPGSGSGGRGAARGIADDVLMK
jgi:hypothetical protein